MERDLYPHLVSWKLSPDRRPLILRGAPRVGKSELLKTFGEREFKETVYLNDETIRGITTSSSKASASTLYILDEIEKYPLALLQSFEKAKQYAIVCTANFLPRIPHMDLLTLYPLCFFEFLKALGFEEEVSYLKQIDIAHPVPTELHDKCIDLLQCYYIVGGMPEAVAEFVVSRDFNKVRKIHHLLADHIKENYLKRRDVLAAWKSIPSQIGKENQSLTFNVIEKTTRSKAYEDALQWLEEAGFIYRSYRVDEPSFPIDMICYQNPFKVFFLDVGLLCTLSKYPVEVILNKDAPITAFKGALIENFVAQEIKAHLHEELFYWKRKSYAEVDFIVPYQGQIYPLEVKAGRSTKQKSLAFYRQQYHPPYATRVSVMNLRQENDFYNYPIYLVGMFPIGSFSKNPKHPKMILT